MHAAWCGSPRCSSRPPGGTVASRRLARQAGRQEEVPWGRPGGRRSSGPGVVDVSVASVPRRGPGGECAMKRRGALRDAAHAAELQVVDDPLRDGLESVVVAGPAPLRPQVLRLEQRHLDGEEEVFAGDRVVVVGIGHGERVAREHERNIVAGWERRLASVRVWTCMGRAIVVQLARVDATREARVTNRAFRLGATSQHHQHMGVLAAVKFVSRIERQVDFCRSPSRRATSAAIESPKASPVLVTQLAKPICMENLRAWPIR